jgi:hypothetical protein
MAAHSCDCGPVGCPLRKHLELSLLAALQRGYLLALPGQPWPLADFSAQAPQLEREGVDVSS